MNNYKTHFFLFAIGLQLCLCIIFARILFISSFPLRKVSSVNEVMRGNIKDRNGFLLAKTVSLSSLGIAPHEIYDLELLVQIISEHLSMPSKELFEKIYQNKNRKFFYIKHKVKDIVADKIMQFQLPGIYRRRNYQRIYPAQRLASNVLGFVGREMEPLEGLENAYDEILTRRVREHSLLGVDLQLTLDSFLQNQLEEILSKKLLESESQRAGAILMDVHTGHILAMASLPNFDPNLYYKSKERQRSNHTIHLNYEPGSTIKIFMAAMLLEEGKVKKDEKFYCPGQLQFYSAEITCRHNGKPHAHGNLTLEEIIRKSCNVGIVKAMKRLSKNRIYDYMHKLGFGQVTKVVPAGNGEAKGYFPKKENWIPSTTFYLPIGQGFSVTPIQLLRAGAIFVNGGKLVQPFLAWKMLDPETSEEVGSFTGYSADAPFSTNTIGSLRKYMRSVVLTGTATRANLEEVAVIGKTGTGEKSTTLGYTGKYIVSFLGFFPYEKPRYGMLVFFDEPISSHTGGSLAAPTLRAYLKETWPYLKNL